MNQREKAAFLIYLTTAAETLDGVMNDVKGNMYFEALKDLSLDDAKRGISVCVKYSKFFPKPVEIREAVQGRPEDAAAKDWDQLIDAIRSIGPEKSIIFENSAVTHFVIGEGGWIKLCSKTSEELKWLKKDFIKLHPGLCSRPQIMKRLAGIHEGNNSHWYGAPQYLAIVGDEDKVRALMGGEKLRLANAGG